MFRKSSVWLWVHFREGKVRYISIINNQNGSRVIKRGANKLNYDFPHLTSILYIQRRGRKFPEHWTRKDSLTNTIFCFQCYAAGSFLFLDKSMNRIKHLSQQFRGRVICGLSTFNVPCSSISLGTKNYYSTSRVVFLVFKNIPYNLWRPLLLFDTFPIRDINFFVIRRGRCSIK